MQLLREHGILDKLERDRDAFLAKGASVSKPSRLQNKHVGILKIATDKISISDEQSCVENLRLIQQINFSKAEQMQKCVREIHQNNSSSTSGVQSETTANSPPSFDTQASPMDDKTTEGRNR